MASQENSLAPSPTASASRWRTWLARVLLLILAPLCFLGILEGGLRLFGYGQNPHYFMKGPESGVELSNPRYAWRFFGPLLSRTPVPLRLSTTKPAGTYRIFVLGASAARGEPNPAFSFGRILEHMLGETYPHIRFEVINTGMTAINSHVVRLMATECAARDADLFIVYLGNNEVVGPYGAGSVFGKFSSLGIVRASIRLRAWRLGQLLTSAARAVARRDAAARQQWGGLAMFMENQVAADDPRLATVYESFRANLEDICQTARDGETEVLLSTVLSNLRDQPPFSSLHRPDLNESDLAIWQDHFAAGRERQQEGDWEAALDHYAAALEVDARHAELHYRYGSCCWELARTREAHDHFSQARDLDALRFRADSRINQIVREVAASGAQQGVHLADLNLSAPILAMTSEGTPGQDLFYEHVHLNFYGNYAVAAALFEHVSSRLPAELRGAVAEVPEPPSIERCAALTLYTSFDQCADARKMAVLMNKPPFAPEQSQQIREYARRLEARLSDVMLDEAEQHYREVLTRRPDDLLLRSNFMDLLFSRRKNAAAGQQCRLLLQQYPDFPDWLDKLGTILAEEGDPAAALPPLERALELSPGRIRTRVALAEALISLDRFPEAAEALQRALAIRPNDAGANFQMGRILLRNRQAEAARRHFLTAIAKQPDTSAFYYHLGTALSALPLGAEEQSFARIRLADALELLRGLAAKPVRVAWESLRDQGILPQSRLDLTVRDKSPRRILAAILAGMSEDRLVGEVGAQEITISLRAASGEPSAADSP